MVHVFVSHAALDRAIADEVPDWLRPDGHDAFLAHDLHNGIGVVTSSFIALPWCSVELGIADGRGCLLIPSRAEARVAHPLIQDRQYVDYQEKPQQVHDRVLQAVRLLDGGRGSWRAGDNPFPRQLRAIGSAGRILAIVIPSGCGKSSLLNAAVVPLLGCVISRQWLSADRGLCVGLAGPGGATRRHRTARRHATGLGGFEHRREGEG